MAVTKPRTLQEARRLAYCWEKAQNLLAEGYQYKIRAPVIIVFNPELKAYHLHIEDGEVRHCTCPDFDKHKDFCKHLLFAQDQLDRQRQTALSFAEAEQGKQFEEEDAARAFMEACALDGELRGSYGVEF